MTDLERYRPSGIVPLDYDLDDLLRKATVLAKSGLVRKALAGKPEAIAAVALRGGELGVSLMTSLDEIDVIEGKTYLSAQLCSSLSRAAGHELEVRATNRDRCVLRGRRREARHRDDAWQEVEWTRERAREAGLLDQWVERYHKAQGDQYARRQVYVVGNDEGIDDALVAAAPEWAVALLAEPINVKRKDNWYRHPVEMLRARATRELCRMVFGDVLSGLDVAGDDEAEHLDAPEEVGVVEHVIRRAEPDEVIEDAELVDDERAPAAPPATEPSSGSSTTAPGSIGTVDDELDDEAEEAAATWDADAWNEHLRSVGVAPARALVAVRSYATHENLEPPASLETIDDPRLARFVLDLDGPTS